MAEQKDFDILDGATLVTGLCVIAASGALAFALPVGLVWLGQHHYRRSQAFQRFLDRISAPDMAQQLLLPPPKDELAITQNKPIDVNVVNSDLPLWQRLRNPAIDQNAPASVLTGVMEKNTAAQQQARLVANIKRLPKYIPHTQLPTPPSKLSVPLGVDSETKTVLWGDFEKDLLHALIAGYTGSGKDALLRLWFMTLTANNTPDDVQFVVVDGKVDWLSPALAESAYMAIPPAGGMDIQKVNGKRVDCAKERIAESFDWIFDLVKEREQAFLKVGAVDMKSYTRKTGIKLPYIFFIASDVGETFDGELQMLINLLIMKARAYGIRLLISLQNPVGEGTKWRSQIGLILTGHQPNPDHDRYTLALNVPNMLYRPSMLPNPEENNISRGLFIMRKGATQKLLRTYHLPEDEWFEYIENYMKGKHDYQDDQLLTQLLLPEKAITKPIHVVSPATIETKRKILTEDQRNAVIRATIEGKSKTEIMVQVLHLTNSERYKEASPVVDRIMQLIREKMNAKT